MATWKTHHKRAVRQRHNQAVKALHRRYDELAEKLPLVSLNAAQAAR